MSIKIIVTPSANFDLNKDVKLYIEKKINSINENFFLNEENVTCNFRIGKNSANHKSTKAFFAEATIETSKKAFGARADEETVEEAIDHLKDALIRKITSYKDKKTTFLKKSGRKTKELLKKILI